MNPSNLQTEWAWLLLDSLAKAGIRDVIVSPGARSTPFVFAAIGQSAFRIHDVIDERSAGFLALGQARVTKRPSLLICTSGTAGAHYFPAVIEAAASHLPLIVLTADRPTELQACGAPQTIDQTELYGRHVRRFSDLGMPDASEGALRALRRTAAQSVLVSCYPIPGPVHLNAPARKPLEPITAEEVSNQEASALHACVLELSEKPFAVPETPRTLASDAAIEELAERCAQHRSGLIICGPSDLEPTPYRAAVEQLAKVSGFPVLAEATSQLRLFPDDCSPCCGSFDALLRSESFVEAHQPKILLQIGLPTSGAWDHYLSANPEIPRYLLSAHAWSDPHATLASILFGDVIESTKRLTEKLAKKLGSKQAEPSAWQEQIMQADDAAWKVIDRELDEQSITEGAVARAVVDSLDDGAFLVVGNSLPIRHLDTFCRTASSDVRVLSQRGANGIDGLVAGAIGSAGASGSATTLLLGDVSFLHDLSALQMASSLSTQLVIVLLNNNGGRIFDMLPVAKNADAALKHWTTPHGLSFENAAAQFNIRYSRVIKKTDLAPALEEAQAFGGCSLVEVLLPENGAAEQLQRVWSSVDDTIASLSSSHG